MMAHEDGDMRAYRTALSHFPTGVAIVTVKPSDSAAVGLTINSFASISLDPPLILWSLARSARSIQAFERTGQFVVNVLGADQEDLAYRFARPSDDRFAGVGHAVNPQGTPLLDGCVAYFECERTSQHDGGDHVMFIGGVKRFASTGAAPLVFCQGRFTNCHNGPAAGETARP